MQSLGCRRGTRRTVVASGFARQTEVSRETSIRATARPHLMRVAPRTHCERESACVPPGSVSIQLYAQVKGRIGSLHVNLLVNDAFAPPTGVSGGKESLMPRRVRFTGNVGGLKGGRSSGTGFPPLRVCRLKSMERTLLTFREGARLSNGSRGATPHHGFDHTSDTGTLPMTRPVSREVTEDRSESPTRPALASVSRETAQWARCMTGSLRQIRH